MDWELQGIFKSNGKNCRKSNKTKERGKREGGKAERGGGLN